MNKLSFTVFLSSRMESKRLPGKALYPLWGLPCLDLCFQRLSGGSYGLLLVTTEKTADNILAEWAKMRSIPFFRGSENDLVDRYYSANCTHPCDFVIRATADCPFIGKELVESCISQILKNPGYDLYTTKGNFPVGLDLEFISTNALKALRESNLSSEEREHLTLKMYQDENLKIFRFDAGELSEVKDFVFTLDTPDDYQRFLKYCSQLTGPTFSIQDLIQSIKRNL